MVHNVQRDTIKNFPVHIDSKIVEATEKKKKTDQDDREKKQYVLKFQPVHPVNINSCT